MNGHGHDRQRATGDQGDQREVKDQETPLRSSWEAGAVIHGSGTDLNFFRKTE
ncbi:hypothetical protein PITCH_A720009 [uncultured Desulfobacterium sp.]|uniref:Uncharacterized protein n=1 Tax=uncultured Desulfobacterium sp. TaxID=201089 RepID=A0A445N1T8_9BACT|nr:hypothetical protein PITCH_A720009 [uncultured Desulfobacterium sp.]